MSSREQVERTADRLRLELMATLEELERRRQAAMDVRQQLTDHLGLVAGVGVGALILTSTAMGFAWIRRRNRRAAGLRERVRGFIRAWEHPDRVAARGKDDRRFSTELARRMAFTAATALTSQLARRAGRSLLPANAGV
jgi:hypothetical protein